MADERWSCDRIRITDDEVKRRIRRITEEQSSVIVEHRCFRRGRAPRRFICDNYETFDEYLSKETSPGDSFYLWSFEDCCRDDNYSETGKVPDHSGRVPYGGAY